MCGIVGYIGKRNALPILVEGLRRLEYRGYDSAGTALIEDGELHVTKKAGKIKDLEKILLPSTSTIGIGHTRWATHGEPNDFNAHPQCDCTGTLVVVHNGVIENFSSLKKSLEQSGCTFRSNTDTEVIAHMIERFIKDGLDIKTATRCTLQELHGTYGIAILSSEHPDIIIAARNGSPLVVGVGDNEMLLASDSSAIVEHTRKIMHLSDGEIAVLTKDSVSVTTIDDVKIEKEIEHVTLTLEAIEKGGYSHFMLKEIFEQPSTIEDTMRGRLLPMEGKAKLGGLLDVTKELEDAKRFILVACGTSWHAALVGKYLLEQFTRIPVEVDYASEFRYRDPIIQKGDIVWAISQSGETADTLAAVREAKRKGALVLGICNVVGSAIARDTTAGVYIHAGPEIGVASTKAFTSQLMVLALISLFIGRKNKINEDEGRKFVSELEQVPKKIKQVFKQEKNIIEIAKAYAHVKNFLYLGRGFHYPVALEGALKLKEISYIHAEGYPAAEMKHGPIALIDADMPVVVIATHDHTYDKILGNMQEIKARRGKIIALVNDLDSEVSFLADHVIKIPECTPFVSPIVAIVPLQLLAYHIAVLRGCPVDQPRNLAKSVTVE